MPELSNDKGAGDLSCFAVADTGRTGLSFFERSPLFLLALHLLNSFGFVYFKCAHYFLGMLHANELYKQRRAEDWAGIRGEE